MERKAGEQRGRDETEKERKRQQGGDGRDNVGGKLEGEDDSYARNCLP